MPHQMGDSENLLREQEKPSAELMTSYTVQLCSPKSWFLSNRELPLFSIAIQLRPFWDSWSVVLGEGRVGSSLSAFKHPGRTLSLFGCCAVQMEHQAELLSQASVSVLCACLTAMLKHPAKQCKVRRVYLGLQFYRFSSSCWERDGFRGRRQRVPLDATRRQRMSRKLGKAAQPIPVAGFLHQGSTSPWSYNIPNQSTCWKSSVQTCEPMGGMSCSGCNNSQQTPILLSSRLEAPLSLPFLPSWLLLRQKGKEVKCPWECLS